MGHIPGELMGQQPNELTPHQSLDHYWGAELRALRTARGLSLAEFGQLVHCSPSYLAKIERAERPIPAALVASCDRALDACGALVRLHTLAEAQREQAATRTHVASEDTHVANQPGNLDEEIVVPARTPDGRVVFVSVPRRTFLHGIGSTALGITATEAKQPIIALSSMGDVHPVEHFQHLRVILRENDNLFGAQQVVSTVREQIAIMRQLRPRLQGTDQHALIRVEAQYLEFYGWLCQDAGEHARAELLTDRALGLCHLTSDRELMAFTLARRAGIAVDRGLAADAIGFADGALRLAAPRSRIAALAATRRAHGHALNSDHTDTEQEYERARKLVADFNEREA